MTNEVKSYGWKDAGSDRSHAYLLPAVLSLLENFHGTRPVKIVDLGCGNGYLSSRLAEKGHSVLGFDVSPDGVEIAQKAYPGATFQVGSIYDDGLQNKVAEAVDCVVSLEVIEHLIRPSQLFQQSQRLLRKGGQLIVSTPYHGYFKNLAISLMNGWDRHFHVERDGGHVKFFSRKSLYAMSQSAGFRNPIFKGVGRGIGIWKSMVVSFEK